MFGGDSMQALKWLQRYKRLVARKIEELTAQEQEELKDLTSKLSSVLEPGSADKPPPRRADVRVDTHFDIVIKNAGQMQKLFIKNISGGGLYLESYAPSPVGTRLELDLVLPGHSKIIHTLAEVAWSNTKSVGELPPGMGVRFINLNPEVKKMIHGLVTTKVEEVIKDKKK